jgi:hypothetical protein
MSAPGLREYRHQSREQHATALVRRQKRNLLRRHWLTGAFVFGLFVMAGYTATHLYHADQRLREVRQSRDQLAATTQEARWQNQNLQAELGRVTSDAYMILKAKEMGFVFPEEQVYQKSQPAGR